MPEETHAGVGYGAWRRLGLATAIVVMTALFAVAGRAETAYPQRPVRIILPYGPGGVADVTTRLIAQKLSERMGQNFFVDNRPGAGGIVAAKAALSFPADGYTLYPHRQWRRHQRKPFPIAALITSIRDFASISMFAKFDYPAGDEGGLQSSIPSRSSSPLPKTIPAS